MRIFRIPVIFQFPGIQSGRGFVTDFAFSVTVVFRRVPRFVRQVRLFHGKCIAKWIICFVIMIIRTDGRMFGRFSEGKSGNVYNPDFFGILGLPQTIPISLNVFSETRNGRLMSLALFAISEKTGSFVVKRMAHWSPILFYHNAKGSFVAFTPVSAFLYGFRERRAHVFRSGKRARRLRAVAFLGHRRFRVRRESAVQVKPFRPGLPFRGAIRLLLGGLKRGRTAVVAPVGGGGSLVPAGGARRIGTTFRPSFPVFPLGAGHFPAPGIPVLGRWRQCRFRKQGRPLLRADPESLEAVLRLARDSEGELKRELVAAVVGVVDSREVRRPDGPLARFVAVERPFGIVSHENSGRNERKDRIPIGPRRFLRDPQRKPSDPRSPFGLPGTLRLFRTARGLRGRREELRGRQPFGRGFPLSRVFSVCGRFRKGSGIRVRRHIFRRPHRVELDSRHFPGRQGGRTSALGTTVVRCLGRRVRAGAEAFLRLS